MERKKPQLMQNLTMNLFAEGFPLQSQQSSLRSGTDQLTTPPLLFGKPTSTMELIPTTPPELSTENRLSRLIQTTPSKVDTPKQSPRPFLLFGKPTSPQKSISTTTSIVSTEKCVDSQSIHTTTSKVDTTNQLPRPLLLFGKPSSPKELIQTTPPNVSSEKCLDSQLWHACAGGMVQIPSVGSKVYYFPQGHAEHSESSIDFGNSPKLPSVVLARVASVKFLADPDTDEVYSKILLVPISHHGSDFNEEEQGASNVASDLHEKPTSFAKTLTQSDANNGGGFSVPRYCAETIFPKLDYDENPPVQTILAKDVHGRVWNFRHIYRGTPRRHLLTTGWSTFLNQKKLVAGDSIVFLRTENEELCVGIRRAKNGICGGPGPGQISGWKPPYGGGLSVYSREEENANSMRMRRSNGSLKTKSRVTSESVIVAARLAASGKPFEIVYYPRASTPEFCVKVGAVRAAMQVQWCPGMRFKMPFETEDSSRISWFMGTVSSVAAADPVYWPNSPWRLLQVAWDEPDLLQNVKRVSPWLVELVSNIPAIHLSPFSPPRKKLCIPPNPNFSQNNHHFPIIPTFNSNPHGPYMGIQGARHANYNGGFGGVNGNNSNTISFPNFHFQELQSRNFNPGFLVQSRQKISEKIVNDDTSWLTMGCPGMNDEKLAEVNVKKDSQLMLFGKPIYTEEEVSLSLGGGSSRYSSSEGGNAEKYSEESMVSKVEPEHCKVYRELDDVGRALDLSVLGSYEELYEKLADIFGLEKSVIISSLCCHDATGSVRHDTDVPFSEFAKTAKRLTIATDSSSSNK